MIGLNLLLVGAMGLTTPAPLEAMRSIQEVELAPASIELLEQYRDVQVTIDWAVAEVARLEEEVRRFAEEVQRQEAARLAEEARLNRLSEADFWISNPTDSYESDELLIYYKRVETDQQVLHLAEIHQPGGATLPSAFAKGGYEAGTQTVSSLADSVGAVLAINASAFYGSTPVGPVVRDGIAYNEVEGTLQPMWIDRNGDMQVTQEVLWTSDLINMNAMSSFRFGPLLLQDYTIIPVDPIYSPRAGANPRTAIGQRHNGNWLIVVAEGRVSGAAGLTLSQLQSVFEAGGCRVAYNLDGGGSTTLWFKGERKNRVSDGNERAVVDMIYWN